MIKVAFRADGGQTVGMGHIMRCLSLAKEFKNSGCKVYFISKFSKGIEKIKEDNFEVIKLTNKDNINKNASGFNYGNKEELNEESREVIEIIEKYKVDLLLIDSYNVTEDYFLKIKSKVKKLGYIDDINDFIYPVDILINGNITGKYMNYEKYSEDEVMLLGTEYNLIRDEFKNLPTKTINREVESIMITTGGSDPYNLTSHIINSILSDNDLQELKLNVVVGNGFANKNILKQISKEHTNVILHENVKYMSKIMLDSDIAISSGGSTLYELAACGTPTMAMIIADNQEFIVEKMDELGYVESLGWYNEISQETISKKLSDLMEQYDKRMWVSKHMRNLVDGKGTSRIVKRIIGIL